MTDTKIQEADLEIDMLRKNLFKLEKENMGLSQELERERELRDHLEREKECTFKNLFDENQ